MYKDNCWTELGNFAYDSEKQQRLIIHGQSAIIPSGSVSCDLQGENLDGYSFLCWIGCASSGWVGTPYIEVPIEQSTKIFEGSKSGGIVLCWAMYTKNPRVVEF